MDMLHCGPLRKYGLSSARSLRLLMAIIQPELNVAQRENIVRTGAGFMPTQAVDVAVGHPRICAARAAMELS